MNEKIIKKKGKPTKYKPEFCNEIIDFFDIPHTIDEIIVSYDKNGNSISSSKQVPNRFPSFEGFASKLGICVDTLKDWTRSYPQFEKAYEVCKSLQLNYITNNAMRNKCNITFAIFMCKNNFGMSDKQDISQTVINPQALKIEIIKK